MESSEEESCLRSDILRQSMLMDEMQIQLNKLQVQCLEERRNYLDLMAENQQLKLEKEDYRRKFQASLLMGKVEEKAVVHFLHTNPRASQLTDEIIMVHDTIKKCEVESTSSESRKPTSSPLPQFENPIVLKKQVEFLQNHLEEVKEVYLGEIFGLKSTNEITVEERELMRNQYDVRIKDLVKKLCEVRTLLRRSGEENLELKTELMTGSRKGKKGHAHHHHHEKDEESKLQEESRDKGVSNNANKDKGKATMNSQLLEKLTRAEVQLIQQENIIKEYELKFIQMDSKVGRLTESERTTKDLCRRMIGKLKSKNEILEQRFEKLDTRRKFENCGFRSDVKELRKLITFIERKLNRFMRGQFRKFGEIVDIDGEEVGDKLKLKPVPAAPLRLPLHKDEDANANVKEEHELSLSEQLERDKNMYHLLTQVLEKASARLDKLAKQL